MPLEPLFKINKGSKGIYIKDEKELEEYILNNNKDLKKLAKNSLSLYIFFIFIT